MNRSGYLATTDLAPDGRGSHFPKWRPGYCILNIQKYTKFHITHFNDTRCYSDMIKQSELKVEMSMSFNTQKSEIAGFKLARNTSIGLRHRSVRDGSSRRH